jgi:hypothetical protein
MTLAHDDANARLLDLVYGEGTAAERQALEAHVATCAACQAQLASLGDTRARVRTALEDAPVPARAHARILEAATQAAAPVAAPAQTAAAAAAAVAPVSAARPPSGPSLWQRLLGKWTLPTFATVGAVAVVVIASKVFLEPEKTMERGREIATATAPPPEAPAAAAARAELEAKVAAQDKEVAESLAKASTEAEKAQIRADASRRFGPSAGARSAFNDSKGGRPGLLGGKTFAERMHAHAAAASDKTAAEEKKAEKRDFAPPPTGWKEGTAAGAVASAPAAAAPEEPAPVAAKPAPPPPAAAPPVAHRAVRKSKVAADNPLDGLGDFRGGVPSASEEADQRVEEGGGGPSAYAAKKAAPKPEAKPVVAASAPASQAAPREKAPAAPAKDAPRPSAKAEKARSNDENLVEHESPAHAEPAPAPAPSQDTLTRRADHFFAVQRWSEAIAAYQELLRLYPNADLKTRWRERIAQAKTYVAQESAQTASKKAAKARAQGKKATTIEAAPAKE